MVRIVLLCCILVLPFLAHGRNFDVQKISEELPEATAAANQSRPEAVERWFRNQKFQVTMLHFFVHDNVTADHPTALLVAPAGLTNKASTTFGSTYVLDDPVTLTPDPNSQIIGRAQGTFSFVSQADPALHLSVTIVFTEGIYKGSTLSILGNNPITQPYREVPVVGGTGAFRLARGTATINTVTVDIAKLNDILEYHVVVQPF